MAPWLKTKHQKREEALWRAQTDLIKLRDEVNRTRRHLRDFDRQHGIVGAEIVDDFVYHTHSGLSRAVSQAEKRVTEKLQEITNIRSNLGN
jgi:hypothetical protein